MAYDIDPDQAVSIVAIFLFIDAAFLGFPLLSNLVGGGAPPLLPLLLVVGLIVARGGSGAGTWPSWSSACRSCSTCSGAT
jgi:hypothetical protein